MSGERLRVIGGAGVGKELTIGADGLVLGRNVEGEGRLPEDAEMSRSHARVVRDESGLSIEDLGSRNGTYLNGRQISEPAKLDLNDVVRIGQTSLALIDPDATADPGPVAESVVARLSAASIESLSGVHAAPPAEPPAEEEEPKRKDPLVVVADRDPQLLKALTNLLSGRGYQVVSAGDGQEALDAVDAYSPDAVVVDYLMPKVQGPDVCQKIKETRDIPVVMMTSKASESAVAFAFERGADEYLTEPFDVEELDSVLRRLLKAA
jgi:CheY-like chemotaxis protein